MTTETRQPLSEFRTGFLTTRVSRAPDGTVVWQHTPGPDRTRPFPPLPAALPRLLAQAGDSEVTWLVPVSSTARELVWETGGRHSLADALEGGGSRTPDRIEAVGARLGTRLRHLHERGAGDAGATAGEEWPRHPGLERLSAWLADGAGPRAAPAFRYRLRGQLGAARWDRLGELTRALLRPAPDRTTTVLHGWFSMGGIVLDDDPSATRCEVLSGPDACRGLPETDLGCLLGELIEYRLATRAKGLAWPLLDRLQHAVLTHYGPRADPELLAAGAVLRIALHAHDYAAYVGWSEQLHGYVPMLAELLDSDHHALLRTA